jgi:hypothetical protein
MNVLQLKDRILGKSDAALVISIAALMTIEVHTEMPRFLLEIDVGS